MFFLLVTFTHTCMNLCCVHEYVMRYIKYVDQYQKYTQLLPPKTPPQVKSSKFLFASLVVWFGFAEFCILVSCSSISK